MQKITLGIDNGTTGTIALIGSAGSIYDEIPTKEMLDGKKGRVIRRIDHAKLAEIISAAFDASLRVGAHAYIERPFTGSAMMINTSVLSARSFEAALIVLEQLGIGFTVIDSKEWQKPLLGDVKGSAELKKASKLRGLQLYPAHSAAINDHGDADGLLIAHYFHNR